MCYSNVQRFPRAAERVSVPDRHSSSPLNSIGSSHRTKKREVKKKPLGYDSLLNMVYDYFLLIEKTHFLTVSEMTSENRGTS